jgi:dihydrofolate synthase/folylpolyglutamate synthase
VNGSRSPTPSCCRISKRSKPPARAAEPVSLTYFEFTTLAILHLFASRGLDAVILEVGLGGRLDAVNVIDTDCAIVTSVDIDHTEYLGDTREKIGSRRPASSARASRRSAATRRRRIAVDHAAAIGADLWLVGRDFRYEARRARSASNGATSAATSATRRWPIRRCAAPTS